VDRSRVMSAVFLMSFCASVIINSSLTHLYTPQFFHTMADTMAPFPRVYFRYVEPLMISFGSLNLMLSGASSAPTYLSTPPHPTLPTEHFLALQAGSMMALAGLLLTIIMWTSNEIKTVRLTIMVLAASDIPHWIFGAWCLGPLAFEPSNWSAEMKAYMGVPAVTFLIKVAYLLGLLGRDQVTQKVRKEL
jgi:hypothetical protein